jgi:hypothetical protein
MEYRFLAVQQLTLTLTFLLVLLCLYSAELFLAFILPTVGKHPQQLQTKTLVMIKLYWMATFIASLILVTIDVQADYFTKSISSSFFPLSWVVIGMCSSGIAIRAIQGFRTILKRK